LKDKKEKADKDEAKVPPRPVAWKRIGKAVLVALVINAIFLATLFIPVVGFVLVLMVGPYTSAFVGGRYLNRNKRGEWLSATFYIVVLWPTILMLLVIGIIQSLGLFALQIEPYGMAILSLLYILTLIFTLVGFYHGSEDMEEEPAEPEPDEDEPEPVRKKKSIPVEEKKEATVKEEKDEPEEKSDDDDEMEDH